MTAAFTDTIHIEGGIISADQLNRVTRAPETPPLRTAYGIPPGLTLRAEIDRAWKITRALRRDHRGAEFATQFLRQALGFTDLTPTPAQKTHPHPPTHQAGPTPVIIAPAPGIDKRQPGLLPEKTRAITPFNLAQTHLNATQATQWGIVTDGDTLRILRNSARLTRTAYVEADLRRITEEGGEGIYADFRRLYLITHASCYQAPPPPATACRLEQWRDHTIQTGLRAHGALRGGVQSALELLGTGFLRHPANVAPKALPTDMNEYWQELLWLVYRLIFLFVTEDRGILMRPNADQAHRRAYAAGYGAQRLRARAETLAGALSAESAPLAAHDIHDIHDDLYEGIKHTFNALQGDRATAAALALPALGGIFAQDRCPTLQTARLPNRALLQAVRRLTWFHDDQSDQTNRVNYRDIGADELGAVYESLLELTPRKTDGGNFRLVHPTDPQDGAGVAAVRKATGSYYTPPTLVEQLLDTALQPRLNQAASPQEILNLRIVDPACGSGHFLIAAARRMATKLADLRQAESPPDPAQILDRAAAHRIAMRDVVANCICGVDKNPMALDLAKTALWLEAYAPQKPLVFLDHHLRRGDSLLSAPPPPLLKQGIPAAAYAPAAGDDPATCRKFRNANAEQLRIRRGAGLFRPPPEQTLAQEYANIEQMPENDLLEVEQKNKAFRAHAKKSAQSGARVAADMYVAAYLMPKHPDSPAPPTSADVFNAQENIPPQDQAAQATATAARKAAKKHAVFHWRLNFPSVFQNDGNNQNGGFDIVLANPPWERLRLEEQEFFAARAPHIATAPTQAARHRLIADLGTDPADLAGAALKQKFTATKHAAECTARYMTKGKNYPLTGRGDVNTYALFAELCTQITAPHGAAGIIVPTNIATDSSTNPFFTHLVHTRRLQSMYDFQNRDGLFPAVSSSLRFSLLTLATDQPTAEFAVFARQTTDLQDLRRRITLSAADMRTVNPNTAALPLYRTQDDQKLCEKIYRAAPILWKDGDDPENNPWRVHFQSMFHMSNDSRLFSPAPAPHLVRLGEAKYIHQYDHRWATYHNDKARELTDAQKQDPHFHITTRHHVPEQIMLARIARIPRALQNAAESAAIEPTAKSAAKTTAKPTAEFTAAQTIRQITREWLLGNALRHTPALHAAATLATAVHPHLPAWLQPNPAIPNDPADAIDLKKAAGYADETPLTRDQLATLAKTRDLPDLLRTQSPRWLMGWRDITTSTTQFTIIAAATPRIAWGNNFWIMHSECPPDQKALLLAMLNSLVVNYVAKQKISGLHFSMHLTKQLPILPPHAFTEQDKQAIIPRVLELTYTATDMQPFYDEITHQNPAYDHRPSSQRGVPYPWNPPTRANHRAMIDAILAKKYGLNARDLRYLLDPKEAKNDPTHPSETFRILQSREQKQHNEYRTSRLTQTHYKTLP